MYVCQMQIWSVILIYDKSVIVKGKLNIVQLKLHAHTYTTNSEKILNSDLSMGL